MLIKSATSSHTTVNIMSQGLGFDFICSAAGRPKMKAQSSEGSSRTDTVQYL